MDFNLDRLRSFIVVSRSGNLSAAARELGTTQPNLGRQMTALEKEVNLTLFARHSRGLNLTKQGQEFLELCQDIVGQLAQRTDVIREKDSEPDGLFRFVSGIGLLDTILENITQFSMEYPKLNFSFSSFTNPYQLQIGDAHAAVIPEIIADPDFVQQKLYTTSMRIYASPEYFKLNSKPKDLAGLKTHKTIVYIGEKQEVLNKPLYTNHSLDTIQPFLEVSSGPAMKIALINSAGIGCYGYNREIMKAGLLVDVFPDMPNHNIAYYYTYHKRLEGSPKVDAFYRFLDECTRVWQSS